MIKAVAVLGATMYFQMETDEIYQFQLGDYMDIPEDKNLEASEFLCDHYLWKGCMVFIKAPWLMLRPRTVIRRGNLIRNLPEGAEPIQKTPPSEIEPFLETMAAAWEIHKDDALPIIYPHTDTQLGFFDLMGVDVAALMKRIIYL